MLCGKSHKLIPLLEPLYCAVQAAHSLAVLNVQNPSVEVSVDLRVAIENIQYKIDMLALKDIGRYTNDTSNN
jgi:hypothetical protein